MTNIKSYTDIEQSQKLIEILPLESADMCYPLPCEDGDKPLLEQGGFGSTPCWSLTALISILPDSIYDNTDEYSQLEFSKKSVAYHDLNDGIKIGSLKDNLIDACVAMIDKLHEQKLL